MVSDPNIEMTYVEPKTYEYNIIKRAFNHHFQKLIFEAEKGVGTFGDEDDTKTDEEQLLFIRNAFLSYVDKDIKFNINDNVINMVYLCLPFLKSCGRRYILTTTLFDVEENDEECYFKFIITDLDTKYVYIIYLERDDYDILDLKGIWKHEEKAIVDNNNHTVSHDLLKW